MRKEISSWFMYAALFVVAFALISASCAAPQVSPGAPVVPPSEEGVVEQAPAPPSVVEQPAAPPSVITSPPTTFSISTNFKSEFGNYLIDAKGMTLYYFTKDVIGKSNASGPVLEAWPIFYAGEITLSSNLNESDFSTILRDDGLKQTAYKGWPLYYYFKDAAPGDTLGEAVNGVWFVMKEPFYTVMLQTKSDLGNYLVDSKGMTLYYFTKDSPGKSTAVGAVLAAWPLFSPESFIVPSGMNTADFGSITREDGLKVATFKDWPLYYYIKDQISGDTLGQGVGGVWFVINPEKFSPQIQEAPAMPMEPLMPEPQAQPQPQRPFGYDY